MASERPRGYRQFLAAYPGSPHRPSPWRAWLGARSYLVSIGYRQTEAEGVLVGAAMHYWRDREAPLPASAWLRMRLYLP